MFSRFFCVNMPGWVSCVVFTFFLVLDKMQRYRIHKLYLGPTFIMCIKHIELTYSLLSVYVHSVNSNLSTEYA